MRHATPYGLEIIESCVACPHREERLFCNLSKSAIERLARITSAAVYPKGATLFVEDQAPRGVFILCRGRAKLSTSSREGKTLLLKVAEPGEVLGLPAAISGKVHEVTAELLEPGQANFIARQDLLDFLAEHGDAALRVAQELSNSYYAAFEEARNIGLSSSAEQKIAQFLLDRSAGVAAGEKPSPIKLTLTHEEIAQMVGASRETVTRVFSLLKAKHLLRVRGATIQILDQAALKEMAEN